MSPDVMCMCQMDPVLCMCQMGIHVPGRYVHVPDEDSVMCMCQMGMPYSLPKCSSPQMEIPPRLTISAGRRGVPARYVESVSVRVHQSYNTQAGRLRTSSPQTVSSWNGHHHSLYRRAHPRTIPGAPIGNGILAR